MTARPRLRRLASARLAGALVACALPPLAPGSLAAQPAPPAPRPEPRPEPRPAPGPAARGALVPGVVAIIGARVLPMTSDTVLADATVLVRDGRVAAVGPRATVRVPAGAQRIDGRGRWVLPGLADMHTHLHSDDDAPDAEVPDSLAPVELGVLLANGITTARLMIGTPTHLALRRDVAAGRLPAPQLWVASPQLTGSAGPNARVVTTPQAARAAVREVAAAGYDFVKLTNDVTPAVWEAATDEARRVGLRVVGHVDPAVGLARALAAGQQIEHLDAFLEALAPDSVPVTEGLTQGGVFRLERWATLDRVDTARIARLGGATARAGVWSGPTLHVFNTAFGTWESDSAIRARPDWRLLPPRHRALYLRARERYRAPATQAARTPERRRRYAELRSRLVRAIADSGGRILAGSDTPEWFNAYGFGLHRELAALVDAGLTPYQALAAATRAPAEFLDAAGVFGTVTVGARADLLVLDADPLADIRHTTRIDGVLLGGRWLPRSALDAMVAAAEGAVAGR